MSHVHNIYYVRYSSHLNIILIIQGVEKNIRKEKTFNFSIIRKYFHKIINAFKCFSFNHLLSLSL
jgi:hypothetical protein